MPNLRQVLETQADNMETMLNNYAAAIIELSSNNGVTSYELDTGQGKQKVTRLDLRSLQATYDSVLNQYAVICGRLNRTGVIHGRPCF